METKESTAMMKKRKIFDRDGALIALGDIEKKLKELKKRKLELLEIAGETGHGVEPEPEGNDKSNVSDCMSTCVDEESGVMHDNRTEARFNNHVTTFVSETRLPTKQGLFRVRAYRCANLAMEPLAIISDKTKDIFENSDKPTTLRVHDQCMTSEVLGSLKCDCREQLFQSMAYIKSNGGVVIYLQQEGRGIGIANKIAAYKLQESGLDTVDANLKLGLPAEARRYEPVKFILDDLNVTRVSLLTNNPFKVVSLQKLGIEVTSRKPIVMAPNHHSSKYLECKRDRMGHYDLISKYMTSDVETDVS